jgi:hypothetical protein
MSNDAAMKSSPRPKSRPKKLKNPAQMDKSMRPKTRSDYETEQDVAAAAKGYKKGGAVRSKGCGGMVSGKKFSGTY